MRRAGMSVLSPLGAVIALGLFFAPHTTYGAATFVNHANSPYMSSISLSVNGEPFPLSGKTTEDVKVVFTVEASSTLNMDIPYQTDNYTFTESTSTTFYYHDSDGNYGSTTVTIDNIDRTPPTITVDPYVTAQTNQPLVVTASANEGVLNATTTTFTQNGSFDFVATDEAGNTSTTTVTIANIDTDAPTITLVGASRMSTRLGRAYEDQGATANDTVNGALTVTVSGSVDSGTPGSYVLTYTATDRAGNSVQATRTVEVVRSSGGGGGGGKSSRSSGSVGSITGGQVLGVSTYNFTRDLSYKSTGADVTALQEMLVAQGYLTEAPTGFFGKKTEAALKAYQSAKGIRQTGVLGPLTRTSLAGAVASAGAASVPQLATLMAQLALLQAKLAALKS